MQAELVVKDVPGKGRRVFAGRPFRAGDVVERAPVVVVPVEEIAETDVLDAYVFTWSDDRYAVALGYGSLYNHDDNPNIGQEMVQESMEIVFTALRDIQAGEQLVWRYGGGEYRVTFEGGRYVYEEKQG